MRVFLVSVFVLVLGAVSAGVWANQDGATNQDESKGTVRGVQQEATKPAEPKATKKAAKKAAKRSGKKHGKKNKTKKRHALKGEFAKYTLDQAHMQVGFEVKHLKLSTVRGHFKNFEGGFEYNAEAGYGRGLKVRIDVDSIDTNSTKRDGHLKNEDFFGVRKGKSGALVADRQYILFERDKKFKIAPTKKRKIKGTLKFAQHVVPVDLRLNFKGIVEARGKKKIVFSATATIDRRKLGLQYDKTGLTIGHMVRIVIDGEADIAGS